MARLFAVSSWGLIVLFGVLTVAHVVLTILFYTGVHDQGYGFFLDFEWPSWLITVIDGSVVLLVLFIRRERSAQPWVVLGAVILVTAIVVGRTIWMIFPLVFAGVLVVDAIRRLAGNRIRV